MTDSCEAEVDTELYLKGGTSVELAARSHRELQLLRVLGTRTRVLQTAWVGSA